MYGFRSFLNNLLHINIYKDKNQQKACNILVTCIFQNILFCNIFTELLSQLNGVRRNAQLLQQVVTNDTTINEIQDKLQQERNKAQEIRQKMVCLLLFVLYLK